MAQKVHSNLVVIARVNLLVAVSFDLLAEVSSCLPMLILLSLRVTYIYIGHHTDVTSQYWYRLR